MKRPNITPGHWKQDARLNSTSTLSGAGKHLATFHRDGNTTVQVHPSAGEAEANALAIAAVPQVLEALEESLDYLATLNPAFVPDKQREAYQKARSALIAAGYQL